MSSSDDEKRKLENERRLNLEKDRKATDDYLKKRKELRAETDRKKAKRTEEQEKRQGVANKAMEELVGETLHENKVEENGIGGPRTFGTSSLKGGILGGMGGSTGPRATGGRDRSTIKAPAGASIPGLEQARSEREKQKRYAVNEGGRFTSNTATGKATTGATAATTSALRKSIRF